MFLVVFLPTTYATPFPFSFWRASHVPRPLAGHKEGLAWLVDCLREAREDRDAGEDDAHEAIPLLPLTEPSVAATEDHNFLNFMAKMGLAPPANEQVRRPSAANKIFFLIFCEPK